VKRTIWLIGKYFLGFGLLLYLIFFSAKPALIWNVLRHSSWPLVALSFSLHAIGLLISAIRWKLLLDEVNAPYSLPQLVRSYLVGTFFNHFLPTRFGGDVVRVADTRRIERGTVASLAVVTYERLSGIIALLVFALVAAIIKVNLIRELPLIRVALVISVLSFVLALIAWKAIPDRFFERFHFRRDWLQRLAALLAIFHGTLKNLLPKKKLLIKVMGWAFLLQLNVIIHYYIIGQALHLQRIPLTDYFFSVPLLMFVLSIPLTVNGIGIRDLFLIKFLSYYAYHPSYAVSFAILDVFFNLILGIAGGIIYTLRKS